MGIGAFLSSKDCDKLNTTAQALRQTTLAYTTWSIGPGLSVSDSESEDNESRFDINLPGSVEPFKEIISPVFYSGCRAVQ